MVRVPEPEQPPGPEAEPLVAEATRCQPTPRTPKTIRPVKEVPVSPDDPLRGQFGMAEAIAGLSGSFPLNATLVTSHGTLHCELWDQIAPLTVANFVGLARGLRPFRDPLTQRCVTQPAYNGLIFHRIVLDFMIQGGDPSGKGTGDPGYVLPDEIDESVGAGTMGTLFMANRGPNTNGMQFFIVHKPAAHLAGRYTAFGQCTPSDVVDRIAKVPVERVRSRPVDPPVIRQVIINLEGPC